MMRNIDVYAFLAFVLFLPLAFDFLFLPLCPGFDLLEEEGGRKG